MRAQKYSDGWQLGIQAAREDNEPVIELFVFHAELRIERKVVLHGRDTGNCGGVPQRFARHCSIKLHRKLLEAGIDVPDIRSRIRDIMGDAWNG